MSIGTTGTGPFTFAWYKNAVAPANAIAGQTGNTLTITNAQFADSGNYLCVVSNQYGSATSRAAHLTVEPVTGVLTAQNRFLPAGIESVQYLVIDQRGRTVGTFWAGRIAQAKDLKMMQELARGAYCIIARPLDGKGKKISRTNSRMMYLP
jgi:hypothetical protein